MWVGNKNLIKGPTAVLGLSTLCVQNLEKDTFILKIAGTVLTDHRKIKDPRSKLTGYSEEQNDLKIPLTPFSKGGT
jgi:hypothetical protein